MASISAMFLGACAAAAQGQIDWRWLLVSVIGILSLEAAKNASGEIFDYNSGTDLAITEEDRSPFSGGKRVIVDGLMTRQQTFLAATIFYLLGISAGLVIVIMHEPRVLAIGFAGVFLAFFYNAPPVNLSYRGFGEIAVAAVYGPLICCGTYLVLRRDFGIVPFLLSIPLGILIATFLVINEFPDRKADQDAGKNNLVVLLGVKKAGQLFLLMVITANAFILILPLAGLPLTVWFGLAGLPFGLAASRRVFEHKGTSFLIPAQSWTLLSFILAAFGLGIGLLV